MPTRIVGEAGPAVRHYYQPMADPSIPDPTPIRIKIPIQIVSDPAPALTNVTSSGISDQRDDSFYGAWDKFLAVQPKRAKTASKLARMIEAEKQVIGDTPGEGLKVRENAAKQYHEAAADCKAKVAAIVAECRRLNRKYVDYQFDLEANSDYCLQNLYGDYPDAVSSTDPPPWIKRVPDIFDKPEFFVDGASATDIHQGNGGDCWFLAALMAISAKKELVEKLCVARDEQVGVYGFVFYRDGEWVPEVIDDKLYVKTGDDDDLRIVRDWDRDDKKGRRIYYDDDKLKDILQRGGEALYFSHTKSDETWLPLIEKAYAKAHGDYMAVEGGFVSEAIEDLTGGVGVVINPEDIMDKELFWDEQLTQVNKKYLWGGGSKRVDSKGVVGGHAYAVLRTWQSEDKSLKLVKLRNPWGDTEWEGDWSDGSKLWTPQKMIELEHTFGDDGVFWMNYKDFLKHFPRLNRLRLFDDNWKVSQDWVSVKVPWTVDYLDTKWQIELTEKGPLIVVLSQPDERYFRGLDGRYQYALHFRVYKEGEENNRWIVRSMENSGANPLSTRSVSAEVEVEPGVYNVVFKITATRFAMLPTPEENILKYAISRKDKLLYVGRRYDYAFTKGNRRAMEAAVKDRVKLDERRRVRDGMRKTRALNIEEKKRARLRKQRVDEVMKEKKKAFVIAKRARAKEKKQRKKRDADMSPSNAPAEAGGDDVASTKDEDVPSGGESSVHKTTEDTGTEKSDGTTGDSSTPPSEPGPTANTETQHEAAAGDQAENVAQEKAETLTATVTKILSEIKLQDSHGSQSSEDCPVSPLEESDDEEYESPLEEPEMLDENDFEWDSDMDGPVDGSDDEESDPNTEIFADDAWNAVCVLGLRVYSLNCEAKVKVIKGEESSA